jgi:hypothetical protein
MSQHNINIEDESVRLALVEQSYMQLEQKLEDVHTQLNNRIDRVEVKVDALSEEMKKGQNGLVKVIVGASGTIVAGIISVIVALIQYS